ncbi:MAG: rhomboid family intramembrane serine protease [Porphyromonadaceae bacterium]|nr:MAG: rhomboid family intramembrane serine protease [Porphyromonadaceae bacterium]
MNPFDEFKRTFSKRSTLAQLIMINVGVFLFLKILGVLFFLFRQENLEQLVLSYLALPADPQMILRKPWTIISYMFLHYDFFHILFNMLWLYWFGKIFLEYLNPKKLISVYLIGGLAGGLVYVLAFNLFPAFRESVSQSVALGASAAVLAIVMAIAFYVPDYTLYLMFFGPVKLKYIALATVLIDILSIRSGNAGGHLAHLGGAMFGFLYAAQLRRGKDISNGFSRFMDSLFSLFKRRPAMKVKYKRPEGRPETDMEYNARRAAEQRTIDQILDKIARSGYEGLSKEEKEILFKSSKK